MSQVDIDTGAVRDRARELGCEVNSAEEALYANRVAVEGPFLGLPRVDSASAILSWFRNHEQADAVCIARVRDQAQLLECNVDDFEQQNIQHETDLKVKAGK
ncbi:MAG: hypothetical protein WAN89_05855 [Lawsonella sp.]|nr:hypothetical protein [Mycobacteriales bacterium]